MADTTGGVLIGASVTVTKTQNGLTRTDKANSAGIYVYPNLITGAYNVRLRAQSGYFLDLLFDQIAGDVRPVHHATVMPELCIQYKSNRVGTR
ncbi:MAG: hypothetical protein AUF76_17530 [Acidobacteria bacterium 13_1_20CM_2_65_9]|nr:MAG: hypothetical protein AUF76_17530 [Acidobacteria bacterium 13_1_20CM_2_65_9]